MKIGDFAVQIFRTPDQADPANKIVVGVEESRREKANDGRNHAGPAIERPPQHLPGITLRRQVIPLAEKLAECPRRKSHFFGCGKTYSRQKRRVGCAR